MLYGARIHQKFIEFLMDFVNLQRKITPKSPWKLLEFFSKTSKNTKQFSEHMLEEKKINTNENKTKRPRKKIGSVHIAHTKLASWAFYFNFVLTRENFIFILKSLC